MTDKSSKVPREFEVHVSDEVLSDLRARLIATRFPDTEPVAAAWKYGTTRAYLKEFISYWLDSYDWRMWERRINRFNHYIARIEELDIHYILEKGSGSTRRALILTHGWPGSFVEFLEIIDRLAHPEQFGGQIEDAFDVIVPSLPGFAFSGKPTDPIGPRDIAAIWQTLMVEVLGYRRFYAQGGDWGAIITSWIAKDYPWSVEAIHLNMMGIRPIVSDGAALSEHEREWLDKSQQKRLRMSAYQQIQGTKPQTLAYGLTDSPAGLAAWILEKFHDWTIPEQDREMPIARDLLVTNIMLYWVCGINTANWIYTSLVDGTASPLRAGEKIDVPTTLLLFPDDLLIPPPVEWAKRAYDVKKYEIAKSGGHFPALENGDLLVADVRSAFRASY
jgi:microsomal epoxide hydrolase